MVKNILVFTALSSILLTGCATTTPTVVNIEKPTSLQPRVAVQKQEPSLSSLQEVVLPPPFFDSAQGIQRLGNTPNSPSELL